MVWAIALVLAAASAWVLIRPLLRMGDAGPGRAAHALAVYRDQLAEIERDLERGVVSAAEAGAARTEIERRILAAAADDGGEARQAGGGRSPVPFLVAGLVPAAAAAIYLAMGSPDLPGQPLAARADRAAAIARTQEFETMVARLAARLAETPDDLRGWVMLGRSYAYLERHADSAESYRRAFQLSGGDPELAAAYGEALTFANDGIVPPPARAAFETVLRARPDDPRARFYIALALEQAGQPREALDRLSALIREAPADAPWVRPIRDRIDALAQRLGLDPRQFHPEAALPGSAAPASR